MSKTDHFHGNAVAIKTKGLTKSFNTVMAVNNLDLEVRRGELFGLVGPDGAGKTTTMRLLTAVMRPTSGEAWIAGCSVFGGEESIKERIGYMSQRFGLYEDLTVKENINFYADIYEVPMKERPARTERLLQFSNLAPFTDRLAGNLSGGMKQKLGLACALIHTPEVLFLDEPTCGVDPVSRRDFWKILYDLLKEGITIFISTAYLDEAERCARIALMHKGSLLAMDEPARVKRSLDMNMIEIVAVNAGAARDVTGRITGIEGVRSVNIFGDRLHIGIKKGENVRVVIDKIVLQGLETKGFRVIEPSLEDVFIAMIGSEEGKATGRPGIMSGLHITGSVDHEQ